MLDPGTEQLITAVASPTILAGIVGFILIRYLNKQEEVAKDVVQIQVKNAVTESRNALIDKLGDDLQKLRDEHTMTKASVEAVWSVLNNDRPARELLK